MQKHFDSAISQPQEETKQSSNFDIVSLYSDLNQGQKKDQWQSSSDNARAAKLTDSSKLDFNFDNFYGSAFTGKDNTLTITTDRNQPKATDSRDNLALDAALKITNSNEQAAFRADMKTFEERQKKGEISADEVSKTFKSVDQLLNSEGGKVGAKDRLLLAQNFMHLAAHPSESDQGIYDTCNVTALQEKLLTSHPSQLAAAIVESTLTGSYTAPDGKLIKLDTASMQPIGNFAGEAEAIPVDGVRCYGTQVLNHILVNEITQRVTDEHNSMLYTQKHERSADDRGERLYSMRDGSEMTFGDSEKAIRSPGLTSKDIAGAIKRHTGEDSSILVKGTKADADGRVQIESSEELAKAIEQAKKEKRTPLLVEVNGADPIFKGGFPDGQHASHVLSVKDYDAKTKTVSVSNQWGKDNDIQAGVDAFYKTMINALDKNT